MVGGRYVMSNVAIAKHIRDKHYVIVFEVYAGTGRKIKEVLIDPLQGMLAGLETESTWTIESA